VAPSGQRRSLPVKVDGFTLQFGRGSRPSLRLSRNRVTEIVKRINELAAAQRRQQSPLPGG
jgi:hypothetical protein